MASADDGRLIVGGETLVVHAPIEPGEGGEIAQHLGAPQHEGIEQADFDIGMPVQRRQYAVHPGNAVVVEQHSHPHPAIGGLDRKSTRLNSRLMRISYAVFCLTKKTNSTYNDYTYVTDKSHNR